MVKYLLLLFFAVNTFLFAQVQISFNNQDAVLGTTHNSDVQADTVIFDEITVSTSSFFYNSDSSVRFPVFVSIRNGLTDENLPTDKIRLFLYPTQLDDITVELNTLIGVVSLNYSVFDGAVFLEKIKEKRNTVNYQCLVGLFPENWHSCGFPRQGGDYVNYDGSSSSTNESAEHNAHLSDSVVMNVMPACSTAGGCSGGCDNSVRIMSLEREENTGDPVTLNNLDFTTTSVDMSIPGRGINFEFKRTYCSRILFFDQLGFNWDFSYNMRLVRHDEDFETVVFCDGEMRNTLYIIDEEGNISTDEFHFNRIVRDEQGFYLMRLKDGTIRRFHSFDGDNRGKLESITTRCGNKMLFQYEEGRLIRVIDTLGRPIDFIYESGKLQMIRDFLGREVVYEYDFDNHLISVTSPTVNNTPNQNDFPEGRKWSYTYSGFSSDPRLRDKIIAMTMPNENANGGQASVTNFYDDEGRLFSQIWGGINDTGINAGGTITYAREIENEDDVEPENELLTREKVTVIDRNNNRKVFHYNINKQLIKKEIFSKGIRNNEPISFVTEYRYNRFGLITQVIKPEGEQILYEYDSENVDRYQRSNLLSTTILPGPRGGDQTFLKRTFKYEPVFNQVMEMTEERGNDPNFLPQNGGIATPERYTTKFVFDYFEGNIDTEGCDCQLTLRELFTKFSVNIIPFLDKLNQGDLNEDGSFSTCGNTILVKQPLVNLRSDSPQVDIEGGLQQLIETRMSYNRFGQIASVETPEGEISRYFYYPENDPDGDGQDINTGEPLPEPSEDEDEDEEEDDDDQEEEEEEEDDDDDNFPQQPPREFDTTTGGYLEKIIVDQSHSTRYRGSVLPTQLKTTFFYDRVGNTIATIDPRGVRSEFVFNELNQVVRIVRAADVSSATESNLINYAYTSDIFYDFNGNVSEMHTEYRDGNNLDLPTFIKTEYTYNILNNVLSATQTVSNNETITTQYNYDANQNLIEVLSPEAVAGNQPGNKVTLIYDERDIIASATSAPNTGEEKVISYNIDKNGNIIEIIDSEDNNGDGVGEKVSIELDGYNRTKRVVNPVGTEQIFTYDPASNVIVSETKGSSGGISPNSNSTSANVLLARSTAFYDEISRVFRADVDLFVSDGVSTTRPVALNDNDSLPGDNKVTSFVDYDRNSRTVFVESASPTEAKELSKFVFDGAQRTIKVMDAEQNEVSYEYDKNSNITKVTRTDVNPSSRIANETFTTINVFDSLNRLERTTNNIGQTNYFFYDSRNLLIKSGDAQGSEISDSLNLFAGNINDLGNITEVIHDGLGRSIQSSRELRLDGQGQNPLDLSNPANTDGKIIEKTIFDKNSRIISVSDDKINTTTYVYDNLNRLITEIFADGKQTSYQFDKDNNVVQKIDNNGNICNYTHDGANRLISKNITPSTANNVQGTTLQQFEYDGLSRLTKATDNNNANDSNDDSIVERKYDSLNRLVEETQNGAVVSMNWREGADLVECIYPNSRQIEYSYDKVNRVKTIGDSGQNPIATYDYIGSRVLERAYKNGTKLTMLNDAGDTNVGYDNLPRLVQMRHLGDSNQLIAGYAYGYNRVNFQEHKVNLKFAQLSELYQLDSQYRVVDFKRGTLTNNNDSIDGTPVATQNWQLDGVGNWAQTEIDGESKSTSINEVNEYQDFGSLQLSYDDNGNLLEDNRFLFTYDSINRITQVNRKSDNTLVATYKYDFMNRRISKEFTRTESGGNGGGNNGGGNSVGEYSTDADTIALYHYNETSGAVIDSSGNNNHGKAPRSTKRNVEGLFDTKAIKFKGAPILVRKSDSLDSIEDTLTLETFVYLDAKKWKFSRGGSLIHRLGAYQLEIDRKTRKASFSIVTKEIADENRRHKKHKHNHKHKYYNHNKPKKQFATIYSNDSIPLNQWVHIAAVYDSEKITTYINCTKQTQEKEIDGDIHDCQTPLFLGGIGFFGTMEETRISKTTRSEFNCNPTNDSNNDNPGDDNSETTSIQIKRKFFYNGWRVIEEHEQQAETGQEFSNEVVSRQYVDGLGIDEHLQMLTFDAEGVNIESEVYFHENARGDTIALTNANGETILQLEYTTYGEVFAIDENGQILEFDDIALVVYTFQGRRSDEETGLMYFRNRYYNQELGRWLQRDPLGYVDSYGLYEAFGGNPYGYGDPLGLDTKTGDLGGLTGEEYRLHVVSCLHNFIKNKILKMIENLKQTEYGKSDRGSIIADEMYMLVTNNSDLVWEYNIGFDEYSEIRKRIQPAYYYYSYTNNGGMKSFGLDHSSFEAGVGGGVFYETFYGAYVHIRPFRIMTHRRLADDYGSKFEFDDLTQTSVDVGSIFATLANEAVHSYNGSKYYVWIESKETDGPSITEEIDSSAVEDEVREALGIPKSTENPAEQEQYKHLPVNKEYKEVGKD